jgi:hypothetical protein
LNCADLGGPAVTFDSPIQAVLTDTESGSDLSHPVTAFGHLLYSFNLEFFGEPCLLVHEHLFFLLKLRLSGVYKTRGDS